MGRFKFLPKSFEHFTFSWIRLTPFFNLIYYKTFSRRYFIKIFMSLAIIPIIGLVRRPYILKYYGKYWEQMKEEKSDEVLSKIGQINIHIQNFDEDYCVVIDVESARGEKDTEAKQKILFQLGNQINEKLSISKEYFKDVKFVFVGKREIYNILGFPIDLPENLGNTQQKKQKRIVEYYQGGSVQMKMEEPAPEIYVLTKQNGKLKLLNSLSYKADLNSIIRLITKEKSKKYAEARSFKPK